VPQLLSGIQQVYSKAREAHAIPGAYRLQRLLGSQYFHILTNLSIILVGGTNGKGSTCALLESIFRFSGLKTGLYTSPHLISPTERIRISGIPVNEKEIIDTIIKLDKNRQNFLPDASFFELMTAAALILFFNKNVHVVICEVGLGGRFDSTNAVSPMMSILTGVDLDHTHILGENVRQIATDKAYIGRRNKPFIVSTAMSTSALNSVRRIANFLGADIKCVKKNALYGYEEIFKRFIHLPYANNIKTVLTALNYLPSTFIKSLKKIDRFSLTSQVVHDAILNTNWPGRFDIRKVKNHIIIFDCAHNPSGIKSFLAQYHRSKFKNKEYNLLFASLKDKKWEKNLKLLSKRAKRIFLTQIINERSTHSSLMYKYVQEKNLHGDVEYFTNLQASLDKSLDFHSKRPLVVIGSVTFVGSVFESLNLDVF